MIRKNIFLVNKCYFKTLIKKTNFYAILFPEIILKKKINIKYTSKVNLKKKNTKGTPKKNFKRTSSGLKKKISIRVTSNNIFCTCINFITNKIIYNGSGGLYKIKVSKKKLKVVYKNILYKFFGFFKKKYKKNFLDKLLICISAPITLRKKVIRNVTNILKKLNKKFLLKLSKKKCFNGCRASKIRRKKNLKFKIYK
jgi:hypothetical protein